MGAPRLARVTAGTEEVPAKWADGDFLPDVKPEDTTYFGGMRHVTYAPYGFLAVVYNTQSPRLASVELRRALNTATDKKQLYATFGAGFSMTADTAINHGIFPTNSSYAADAPTAFVEAYPYSTDNARFYLNRAAVIDPHFTLMVCSDLDGARVMALADAYKQMMGVIGVAVEVHNEPRPAYLANLESGQFDAAVYIFQGLDHVYDVRSLFGTGGFNFWRVQDDQLNVLLTEFGKTLEFDRLRDKAAEIHRRVNELAPACFLFVVPRLALYAPRLTNAYVHPEAVFTTVEKWQLTP
jgi:ABC-type transport system substrate-binding protein